MTEPATASYSVRLQSAVYGTAFFNGTTQSMATTIFALLLVGTMDGSLTLLIGIMIAARQFLTIPMAVYSGSLLDHFGTRRVIIAFGLAGVFFTLIFPALGPAFGLTPTANTLNPGWGFVMAIILLQMVSGWSEATTWMGSQTLVGQLMKGHPVYAGRMIFVARIGGFLGPPAIGAAWDLYSAWGGFIFLALWIAGGVIAAYFLPDNTNNRDAGSADASSGQSGNIATPPRKTSSDYAATIRLILIPAIALVIMATVMRQTGSGIQSSFYVIWLSEEIELSGNLIGWLIGSANAASALSALGMGPLTRRYAAHWLLILMIGLSIVAIAITPIFGTTYSTLLYITLLAAIAIRGIGQGLNLPLMMMIMSQNVGPDLQGRVTALRITFNRLGGMTVPLIMGGLAEFVGLANSFYIIGATGVLALCALSIWVARSQSFRKAD